METAPTNSLIGTLARLLTQVPIKNRKYYCLTLGADPDYKIWATVFSEFVGFSSGSPRFELRKPSYIRPTVMRNNFRRINEPAYLVNDEKDAFVFLLVGGHAIIESEIGPKLFPRAFEVQANAPLGTKPGFIVASAVPRSKLVKRPRTWMKKFVRERDGGRCRICGRGPTEKIELTLHHITMRVWAGFTEVDNLITLCRPCHDEYGKFNNVNLYELIGVERMPSDPSGIAHRQATERYREKIKGLLGSILSSPEGSQT